MGQYSRALGVITPSVGGYEYFSCPGARYIQLQVVNGAIDYQFGHGFPVANYGPVDDTLFPGTLVLPVSADEIRFKKHLGVTSSPAQQISITAFKGDSVPFDNPGAGYSPTYLTIDANGNVSANFTGHVKAQGIDIDASPTIPFPNATNNALIWNRPSDNAITQQIYGVSPIAGNPEYDLEVRAVDPDNPNIVYVELLLSPQRDGGLGNKSVVLLNCGSDVTGTQGLNLFDSLGRSDFVQLPSGSTLAKHLMTGGVGTVTFSAGTVSAAVFVTHNMNTLPSGFAVAAITGGSLSFNYDVLYDPAGSSNTQARIVGFTTNGVAATGTAKFMWMAFA